MVKINFFFSDDVKRNLLKCNIYDLSTYFLTDQKRTD